jgi:hypothetical protein
MQTNFLKRGGSENVLQGDLGVTHASFVVDGFPAVIWPIPRAYEYPSNSATQNGIGAKCGMIARQ